MIRAGPWARPTGRRGKRGRAERVGPEGDHGMKVTKGSGTSVVLFRENWVRLQGGNLIGTCMICSWEGTSMRGYQIGTRLVHVDYFVTIL